MKHNLPADVKLIWDEVLAAAGEARANAMKGPALEAYCGQIARLREAQKRLNAEGLVIADPKGNPIPHPAIAIERTAQDEIRKWGKQFTSRPS